MILCFQTNDVISGAGYGAPGGGADGSVGGLAYGLVRDPQDMGSGGGDSMKGGSGGGFLHLKVHYTLNVEGEKL